MDHAQWSRIFLFHTSTCSKKHCYSVWNSTCLLDTCLIPQGPIINTSIWSLRISSVWVSDRVRKYFGKLPIWAVIKLKSERSICVKVMDSIDINVNKTYNLAVFWKNFDREFSGKQIDYQWKLITKVHQWFGAFFDYVTSSRTSHFWWKLNICIAWRYLN